MKKNILKILCASFAAVSFYADAALIDNGAVTVDDRTSLEWLDLSQTVGMAYADVVSETNVGGMFDGYRVATRNELQDYLTAYIFNQDLWLLWVGADINVVLMAYDDPAVDELSTGSVQSGFAEELGVTTIDGPIWTTTETEPHFATALVMSSVPVPAAVWLFSSGLVGLIGLARRK